MHNIPTVRHYIERHVFQHAYRAKDGKLYSPKRLGAVVFPNGRTWALYEIGGVRYVTQSFDAKAFKPLENVESDKVAQGGVVLLYSGENLMLAGYFAGKETIANREVLEAIKSGKVIVE